MDTYADISFVESEQFVTVLHQSQSPSQINRPTRNHPLRWLDSELSSQNTKQAKRLTVLLWVIFLSGITSSTAAFSIRQEKIREPWYFVSEKLMKCFKDCENDAGCTSIDGALSIIANTFSGECKDCVAKECSEWIDKIGHISLVY